MPSSIQAVSVAPVCIAVSLATTADAGYESGFARFSRVSDTIQILGNTNFGASYGPASPDRGDFTYEMNIRLAPGSSGGHIISEQRDTWEDKTMVLSSNGNYAFSAIADNPTGTVQGNISGMPVGEWMHLAYVKHGSVATIYVNGSAVASHTPLFQYGDDAGSWMSIGMFRYGAGYIPTGAYPSFLGDLDWIRVSAGAKYAGSFVPPTEAQIFADASTQLLLRFNEAPGSSVLIDESTSRFRCNMGVPVYPGVTATSPELMFGTVPAPATLTILCGWALTGKRRRRTDC